MNKGNIAPDRNDKSGRGLKRSSRQNFLKVDAGRIAPGQPEPERLHYLAALFLARIAGFRPEIMNNHAETAHKGQLQPGLILLKAENGCK